MFRQPRLLPLLGSLALATIAALTGCSAGQVTQTSSQVATIQGAQADVGDLGLRDIRILYPSGGTYAEGSTAELALVVTNQGLSEDTLIEVTGEFFESAILPSDDPTPSSTTASTATPTATPSGEEPAQAGDAAPVPAQGILQFGTSETPTIQLTDLTEEISVAEILTITFVFEQAGEVTVEVPVANPTREIDREEGYDFHTEEAG
ncbi:MAG: hypothetical protein M3313_11335 [Actinomycetota bacterium]|nr:hypothetical protein [Actinomycetota bacterium]